MEAIGVIIGLITLIPVGIYIYDRFVRKVHRVSMSHDNIVFVEGRSLNKGGDEKLALLVVGLKITNSGTNSITLKEIILKYTDEDGTRETNPYPIPTGNIDGKEAAVVTNLKNHIAIAWEGIWEKIVKNDVISPGGVVSGSTFFVLETPIHRANKIKTLTLIIKDYSGYKTKHRLTADPNRLNLLKDNFLLITDAVPKKSGRLIEWERMDV